MTERYEVKYEPLAQIAVQEAVAYIREQSGDGRAVHWLRNTTASIAKLETLPRAFGVCAVRQGDPVFSKLVPPYRIFYVVKNDTMTVHIVDIVHTARETELARWRDD